MPIKKTAAALVFLIAAPFLRADIKDPLLNEILDKMEKTGPFRYERSGTSFINGKTIQFAIKAWEDGQKSRFESGGDVTIFHPDAHYVKRKGEAKFVRYSAATFPRVFSRSIGDLVKNVRGGLPAEILGEESVEGRPCLLLKTRRASGNTVITETFWVWREKGVPIKSESSLERNGAVSTDHADIRNIVFGPFPKNLLAVPGVSSPRPAGKKR